MPDVAGAAEEAVLRAWKKDIKSAFRDVSGGLTGPQEASSHVDIRIAGASRNIRSARLRWGDDAAADRKKLGQTGCGPG